MFWAMRWTAGHEGMVRDPGPVGMQEALSVLQGPLRSRRLSRRLHRAGARRPSSTPRANLRVRDRLEVGKDADVEPGQQLLRRLSQTSNLHRAGACKQQDAVALRATQQL